VKDSGLCEVCKLVVQEVDTLLSDNSTEAQIKDYLDNLCHNIPLVGSLCQQVVDEYLDQIIQALLNNLTPTQVCEQDLNLCNSAKVVSPKSETTCELCEFVISELNSTLSNNSTVQEVIAEVEQVCSILPQTIKQQCDDFIQDNALQIIKLLQTESPEEICTVLELCSNEHVHVKGKLLGLGKQ
jgi:saposin